MRDPAFRTMPILLPAAERREHPDCPASVPWSMFMPHAERRAMRNHDQPLGVLARRGGLHPKELWAILTDQRWADVAGITTRQAIDAIVARLGGGLPLPIHGTRSPPGCADETVGSRSGPPWFWWAVHNLIAHPAGEVLHWIGLGRLGGRLHDATIPRHVRGEGRG